MSPPLYYPPSPLVEDRSIISAPQDERAFSHYNQSEQLCYHHGGGFMNNAVMSTWASGGYDYGRNNEPEARSQEQLATLLNPLIVSMSEGDAPNEPVFLPEDNLLSDGAVDPRELSLPVVKVPCPQCGRLLKDEKSVRYVSAQGI
jgi:hypothetical protein